MKTIRFLAGIIISVFFLYLVFRRVDLREAVRIISAANIWYVLLVIFLVIPGFLARSFRWKTMLRDYRDVPISSFFESISVGVMSSNLLPFRAGDLVQVLFLNYKTSLSRSTILSTVILERLCDFSAMCIILIGGSFFVLLPEEISLSRIGIFLVLVVLVAYFVFGSKKRISALAGILPESRIKDRLKNIIENFYLGLSSVNRADILVKIVLLTAVVWFFSSLGIYLSLLAVGVKLSLWACIFILSMTGLASMVPVSPGYVGPLEFIFVTGLMVFGVNKNYALSFTVLFRIISWLPPTLLGLAILLKNNFSFRQLSAMSYVTSKNGQ